MRAGVAAKSFFNFAVDNFVSHHRAPSAAPKHASEAFPEVEAALDAEASRALAVIMPDGERTFCTAP
jgi:hypothetical protein